MYICIYVVMSYFTRHPMELIAVTYISAYHLFSGQKSTVVDQAIGTSMPTCIFSERLTVDWHGYKQEALLYSFLLQTFAFLCKLKIISYFPLCNMSPLVMLLKIESSSSLLFFLIVNLRLELKPTAKSFFMTYTLYFL